MPEESFVSRYIATPSSHVAMAGGILVDRATKDGPLTELWKKGAKHVADNAKVSALLALPVGLVPLVAYLLDESAPLPLTDTSITILLYLVSVTFLFITFMALSSFLLPFYRRFGEDFSWKKKLYVSQADRQQAGRSMILLRAMAVYFAEFGHFVIAVCALGVAVSGHERWALALLSVGAILWAFYGVIPRLRHAGMRGQKRTVVASEMLMDFGSSLLSLTLTATLVYVFAKQGVPRGHDALMISVVLGVPLLLHAFCFVIVTGWDAAFAMYAILVFNMAMLGPGLPFLGGATLSMLGLGGNLPVSVTLKTYGRTGTVSGTEELTGCLVIMTGADVILRPTFRRSDCALRPTWWFNRMAVTDSRSYANVNRYPRADVLKISGFESSCGTVDGLPDPSCSGAEKPAGEGKPASTT